jgi:hypothetical protein
MVVGLVATIAPFSGTYQIAHETVRLHLALIGSSIYEYRSITGQWPARIQDLAKTSLPLKCRYWKLELDDEVFVIVWHKDLKPDPKVNGRHILAYHNKGLIATMGHRWVCRGDLSTEYIPTEDLRDYLQKLKK